MNSKPLYFCLIVLSTAISLHAQEKGKKDTTAKTDINALLDDTPHKEYVDAAFKAPRVIMSHSIEMVKPGVLSFLILHRFGNINLGPYDFYGLDQATIRLGLDYGVTKEFTVGIGRGSYKKEIDAFAKYRIIHQATGPDA